MKKSGRKTTTKKPTSKKAEAKTAGIKKKYVETGSVCKVTFRLPKTAAPNARRVCIAGDFNNWNTQANPMKRQKNGDYNISFELEPGREYQFRYLIDGSKWENDWNADKYVKSPFGDSDNSVIIV
jgi:1,4-alpha-glucan branching enzyme